MKAFKTIMKIFAGILAIAAVAGGIYLLVTRIVGDKKAATYYDDEDFFECDCDACDVIDCEDETPAAVEEKAEAPAAKEPAKKEKK